MDYYTSYNLKDIRRRQADEVIDEDKKIARRVLDNEFSFVSRLNKETQPSKFEDKNVLFNIERYLNLISNELQGSIEELSLQVEQGKKEFKTNIGKAIVHWNELINYLKVYRSLGKMSQQELNDVFELIQKYIGEPANKLNTIYSQLLSEKDRLAGTENEITVSFPDNNGFRQLLRKVNNKELTLLFSSERPTKSEIEKIRLVPDDLPEVEGVDGDDDEEDLNEDDDEDGDGGLDLGGLTPEQVQDYTNRLGADYVGGLIELRTSMAGLTPEQLAQLYQDVIQQMDLEFEFGAGGQPADPINYERFQRVKEAILEDPRAGQFIALYGEGKKRKGKKGSRKPNKKMDADEIDITMVVKNINDFKKNEQSLKHPKNERIKPSLAFDDSRDSNYI